MVMTFGSLFAGIGGLDLGLERSGMQCKWQVEINEYASKVLAKHWPDVQRHDDVRTWPQSDTERVDVICGGFPCQDISNAGRKQGIEGERSGLWSEYIRIIRVLRPKYVLIENVAALLIRGLDRVLGELAQSGYDAEWETIQADWFGVPQRRSRLFIIAYVDSHGLEAFSFEEMLRFKTVDSWHDGHIPTGVSQELLHAMGYGREVVSNHKRFRSGRGVPDRVERLKGLGNAVVPQVAEFIGRQIIKAECRQ